MNQLRKSFFKRISILVTGILFLNINFIPYEASCLKLYRAGSTTGGLWSLVSFLSAEEENGTEDVPSGHYVKELQITACHTPMHSSDENYLKLVFHFQIALGESIYLETFSPPPELHS